MRLGVFFCLTESSPAYSFGTCRDDCDEKFGSPVPMEECVGGEVGGRGTSGAYDDILNRRIRRRGGGTYTSMGCHGYRLTWIWEGIFIVIMWITWHVRWCHMTQGHTCCSIVKTSDFGDCHSHLIVINVSRLNRSGGSRVWCRPISFQLCRYNVGVDRFRGHIGC